MKKTLLFNLFLFLILFSIANLLSPFLFEKFLSAPLVWPYIPEGIRILNQSSKASLKPKNYIGIVGDSYAYGYGDWFTEKIAEPHAKYSAGHILHNTLNMDVISFGQVGAGSIRSMVGAPGNTIQYLKKTLFYGIADPEIILVFFYEGNDLSDNVEYVASADKCISKFDENKKYDPVYFEKYMEEVAITKNELHREAESFNFFDNFFIIKMINNIYKMTTQKKEDLEPYKCSPYAWFGRTSWKENGAINVFDINGVNVRVPDSLQGPSTDLDAEELEFGLFSFEQSLIFLKQQFKKSRIAVVYIPSVLSSYQITSSTVSTQPFIHKDSRHATPAQIYNQSDFIEQNIEKISDAQKVFFMDARPYIRNVAKHQLVHGPNDWNHLNKAGYTALGQALVDVVTRIQKIPAG